MRCKAAIEGRHPVDVGDEERGGSAMPRPEDKAFEPEPCGGGVGLDLRLARKERARLCMAHRPSQGEIGRAQVCTTVPNAQLLCRSSTDKKNIHKRILYEQ